MTDPQSWRPQSYATQAEGSTTNEQRLHMYNYVSNKYKSIKLERGKVYSQMRLGKALKSSWLFTQEKNHTPSVVCCRFCQTKTKNVSSMCMYTFTM